MLLILILLAGQGSYGKLPDVGARQPCACACVCACQTAPWFSSHKRSFSSSQVRHLYHQILLQATIGSNVRPFDWSDRRKKGGRVLWNSMHCGQGRFARNGDYEAGPCQRCNGWTSRMFCSTLDGALSRPSSTSLCACLVFFGNLAQPNAR
ncbi:hypothetical protein CCUS01_11548 [Colletotrichum cuscutae]|uniref:Secreted protein n=3 Tax=Colletotrichum acutatum species complex TaxID=2707335 RepID=A0AAJ0E5E5_9PEZI|nr:uncharacterized protein CCOS01_02569 [Colletotrichum costaricense]XP_060383158.1 uncharacterized protein CTAM01_05938 [Colletotrichum tamarilloi]KAI3539144.1 hypothetical protein CSPX01_09043 [Colletotrichum filicis]KAK1448587.1 hypothetical protein CCUS01_11548 [Colletotrichum cuscutae]KAK1721645.1 hypothetical protein BDP67DRAFT_498031 [Colletotrichum lupini]KAK1501213.1 hypothetical protein CTAM01_05938 [Colletotrichum tamarilloi]KAK1537249.1 hypothetical protein CCOS01_02569 [Colletotr